MQLNKYTHTHKHTGCGLTERDKLRGGNEHSLHHNSERLTERENREAPAGDNTSDSGKVCVWVRPLLHMYVA